MRLTIRNIHQFLLGKGLIKPKSIIDGDYMVTQTFTRNSIFKIIRKKEKSLFVKQLNSFDQNNTYVLQKDATCLWLIKHEPSFRRLNKYVPEYFGMDPENQVLITEFVKDSISLEALCAANGLFPENMVEPLAQMIASYHFVLNQKILNNRSVQFFPKQIPWALTLAEMNTASFQQHFSMTAGPNPVINVVITNPDFVRLLRPVKDSWVFSSLIHGDIKWMNMLVESPQSKPKLKLIDWEIADIGDPLWDVAGVFAGILTSHLLKMEREKTASFSFTQTNYIEDLKDSWALIRKFWNSYQKKEKTGLRSKEEALKICIGYTGGRLIQSAIEQNMMMPQIQPIATSILQASYTILEKQTEVFELLAEQKTVQS